jgi:hypothetical protein
MKKSRDRATALLNSTLLTAYITGWLTVGNSEGVERKFSCSVSRCGIMNATQTQSCKKKPILWLQNGVETELSCLTCRKT